MADPMRRCTVFSDDNRQPLRIHCRHAHERGHITYNNHSTLRHSQVSMRRRRSSIGDCAYQGWGSMPAPAPRSILFDSTPHSSRRQGRATPHATHTRARTPTQSREGEGISLVVLLVLLVLLPPLSVAKAMALAEARHDAVKERRWTHGGTRGSGKGMSVAIEAVHSLGTWIQPALIEAQRAHRDGRALL